MDSAYRKAHKCRYELISKSTDEYYECQINHWLAANSYKSQSRITRDKRNIRNMFKREILILGLSPTLYIHRYHCLWLIFFLKWHTVLLFHLIHFTIYIIFCCNICNKKKKTYKIPYYILFIHV